MRAEARRRRGAHTLACALLSAMAGSAAGAPPVADEAGVRAGLAACVAAWNGHDPKRFADICLTDDIWFSEADDSFYKRFRGRDAVLPLIDYVVRHTTIAWEPAWIRPQPDGTVAVRLRQESTPAPGQRFTSDPSFARLRRVGDGWKVYFFTSHERWAKALIAALDAPAAAAPTPAPVPLAAAVPGTEPPAWAAQFGERGMSCFYCHGAVPSLRDDPKRGRVIAVAAAAADGAAVRRAMADPRLGGLMNSIVDEPALTDAHLDSIRLWMRALRDGRVELAGDTVRIHNPRSPRDEPARLAELRVEGGLKPPRVAGCRVGQTLAGGTHCELHLTPNGKGTLVFRFAASEGLQPRAVRVEVGAP